MWLNRIYSSITCKSALVQKSKFHQPEWRFLNSSFVLLQQTNSNSNFKLWSPKVRSDLILSPSIVVPRNWKFISLQSFINLILPSRMCFWFLSKWVPVPDPPESLDELVEISKMDFLNIDWRGIAYRRMLEQLSDTSKEVRSYFVGKQKPSHEFLSWPFPAFPCRDFSSVWLCLDKWVQLEQIHSNPVLIWTF